MNIGLTTASMGLSVARMVDNYATRNPDSAIGQLYGKADDKFHDIMQSMGGKLNSMKDLSLQDLAKGMGTGAFTGFVSTLKGKALEFKDMALDKAIEIKDNIKDNFDFDDAMDRLSELVSEKEGFAPENAGDKASDTKVSAIQAEAEASVDADFELGG